MRHHPVWIFVVSIMACATPLFCGGPADFSGIWKQANDRCEPKRSGNVALTIRHHDPELIVETLSKGLTSRHASQRYTTDGVESASTGADGDEFHSKVIWQGGALLFDIVEIEDGKRLKSTETWILIDDGRTLKRVRHTEKSGDRTLIYTLAN